MWMLLAGMLGCTGTPRDTGKTSVPAPNPTIPDIPAEYGTPYAEFTFSGKVTDKGGNPIEGIEVRGKDEDREYVDGYDPSVLTDENGEYSLEHRAFPVETYYLRFKDIDGELNGSFDTFEENIELKKEDFTGEKKGWFSGYVNKTVNAAMEETSDNAEQQ